MLLRSTLLFLSRSQWLRSWVENSPVGRRLTRRFVAGRTLEEGLAVCARLNSDGVFATLDHLGENVGSVDAGAGTRDAYLEALRQIASLRLESTVSIKLTHFGLALSEERCFDFVEEVVSTARELGNSVEVDMESLEYVDATLRVVRALHSSYGSVRAVIQAYLRRSEDDIRQLCRERIPVRLCKGAYKEPSEVAFPEKREVDDNYRRLTELLLRDGVKPALATHDERIVQHSIRQAEAIGKSPNELEFQMLYGIRRSLQDELVGRGFSLRLYVPYGVAWYPYFMRRLAERPANVLFLARNLIRN